MKVLIIGGGYAGCCTARILADMGHRVILFEKEDRLGGLAKSYTMDGMTYEFGPHILANHACDRSVIDFIMSFIDLADTSIESASFVEEKYLNYPPNIRDLPRLKEEAIIRKELGELPRDRIDETNFENYLISKVGKTLYKLFFRDFTEKFWQVDPKSLDASWARLRHLGESLTEEKMFFNKIWCTYPKRDFNELFDNISRGIDVRCNMEITGIDLQNCTVTDANSESYTGDFLISTLSLDRLLDYKFGHLRYSGYDIEPVIFEQDYYHPENPRTGRHYGMVYYPEKDIRYTRTTEYKCFNRKENDKAYAGRSVVTIETPSKTAKFYPFMDAENEERYNAYVKDLSGLPNVASLGRMGLYKYQTIDTTTQQIFRFKKYFDTWSEMTPDERRDAYRIIRDG